MKKTNYESVSEFAAAIRDHRDRVWLRRRSNDERWSGLWDFPRYNPEDTAESIAKAIGFAVTLDELLATIRHGVTRFRITLHLTGGSPSKSSPRSKAEARWFTLAELSEIPLTAPARRLSALLGET